MILFGFTLSKQQPFSLGKRPMRLPTVVVRGDVLESWLTVSDYTKSRLANELGVSKGRISQLLTSQEEPSAHLIAKLIILTNLPFERLFKVVHGQSSSVPHRSTSSATSSALRPAMATNAWPAGRDLATERA